MRETVSHKTFRLVKRGIGGSATEKHLRKQSRHEYLTLHSLKQSELISFRLQKERVYG